MNKEVLDIEIFNRSRLRLRAQRHCRRLEVVNDLHRLWRGLNRPGWRTHKANKLNASTAAACHHTTNYNQVVRRDFVRIERVRLDADRIYNELLIAWRTVYQKIERDHGSRSKNRDVSRQFLGGKPERRNYLSIAL